jgi:hypothetical protein
MRSYCLSILMSVLATGSLSAQQLGVPADAVAPSLRLMPQVAPSLVHQPANSLALPLTESQVAPGMAEGRLAAETQSVVGRVAVGLVGGVLVGFFGLPAAFDSPRYLVPVLVGGASIVLAAAAGESRPKSSVTRVAGGQESDFERGFVEGYSSRLKRRRNNPTHTALERPRLHY